MIHLYRCHKNIPGSWKEITMPTFTGIWKKLIPTLTGDVEGSRRQGVTSLQTWGTQQQNETWSLRMWPNCHDLGIEPERLRSHFLCTRRWFLVMASAPGEDTVKTVETTAQGGDYSIH